MLECSKADGGSYGQVVMGGDSCSEDCGFKSQHCILDKPFFTLIQKDQK